jgi:hypothetical protein
MMTKIPTAKAIIRFFLIVNSFLIFTYYSHLINV